MSTNGNKKFDNNKADVASGFLLRFPRAAAEVARVSTAGCTKYSAPLGDMGYLNVDDGYRRYTEALGRHLIGEKLDGPVNTEKGGALPPEGVRLYHAAQVAWCALARLEIALRDGAYGPLGDHKEDNFFRTPRAAVMPAGQAIEERIRDATCVEVRLPDGSNIDGSKSGMG